MRFAALFLVPLVACTDPDLESASQEGVTLTDANSFVVEIAQAGAFSDFDMHPVTRIHYGFSKVHAPGWSATDDVFVEYDENHESLPVAVRVPNEQKGLLAFVIFAAKQGANEKASADQFIPLDAHTGKMLPLPIHAGAGYPFSPECYQVLVQDETVDGNSSYFDGRPTRVYYGFTSEKFSAYQKDNNLPWQNSAGDYAADGVAHARYAHDGGYKGSYVLLRDWVRVPEGKNLVFKVAFDKYGGSCWSGNDTWLKEQAATQTYFVEP